MTSEIQLKPREIEILQLLAEGLTDNEIAVRLHLANNTVRWYNKKIFEKLRVTNRTQAVKHALRLNLLPGQERGVVLHQNVEKSAVKYVNNSGVHIAYQTIGNGPVDLLFIHGFLSNLELAWEQPEFSNFFETLGRFARVILFDKRGVGLSDRIQGAPSIENTIDDAICVLNEVVSKQAFVLGTSEGGAGAVLLTSMYPERVHGLILYASTPKLIRNDSHEPNWAGTSDSLDSLITSLQESWGEPWAIEQFSPSRVKDEVFCAWWAKILRASSSPSSIKEVINVLREIDICALLPQIQTRTLVIHKRNDQIVNIEAGRYFATHMPNAKWVELQGADHIYFVESKALLVEISKFIQQKPSETNDTWIGIVMLMQSKNLKKNENKIQGALNTFHCKNASFTETEILTVFDSPSRAIQCALKLRETIKDNSMKISLHVGECNLNTNKPSVVVVDTTRRVLLEGKIVVTQTLRDILAGSGIVFDLNQIQIGESKKENTLFYTLT